MSNCSPTARSVRQLTRPFPPTLAGKDGQPAPSKYDLVANLVHEGKAGQGQGTYRVHIHRKARLGRAWYGVG